MSRFSAKAALLCIFTVSGFSGLIYESIWSHYLKLFLGHAAYSQVLVLVIFMGGLAIGSAFAARFSTRWKRVLLAYALVEGITGAIALVFHGAFDGITQASFAHVIPQLHSATAVHAYKWGLGALMILPQSILLGMTFPLMSAGFVRLAPDAAGRSVAMLYFTNSLGGAVGVLMSGFVLIPNVGLPGAIMTAGLLNVLVGLATWMLLKKTGETQLPAMADVAPQPTVGASALSYRFLLAASLVTGMASFCYEIGWLRMLSPVLGASTHAFELMLSSFILGLALGGFWIRQRIQRSADLRGLLGGIQLAMGLAALLTLVIYGSTFEWMAAVMSTFARTEQGYVGFNWASHAIATAVMLPATFCAGMTLPVITVAALRGGGERAIGAVYAANTAGAIIGVVLSVHLLMPLFNAKGVIVAGAALDFGLGLMLWRATTSTSRFPRFAAASFIGSIVFLWIVMAVEVDPLKIVSSVFRYGISRSNDDEIMYFRDGKTATVTVSRKERTVALATNGKVDASVNMGEGPATKDEQTQALLGALPLMLHSSVRTVAVIGFGSGMSSHVLLGDKRIERVDTIEIEARMVEAARVGFFPRNRLAFEDPRSQLHVEDAKTFFSLKGNKYDLIVSEPSNPWVSGVSSLFTYEFYRHVVGYLKEGGMLAQWMQLYEIDSKSLAAVVKALSPWFSDYAIYMTDEDNILIVARRGAAVGEPEDEELFSQPQAREQLARAGVLSNDDVRSRWIGNKALLDPYFRRSAAPVNSDYFPFVDHQTPKSRFMQANAMELARINASGLPIPEMLAGRDRERRKWRELSPRNPSDRQLAQLVIRSVMEAKDSPALGPMRQDVLLSIMGAEQCGGKLAQKWETAATNVGRYAVRYLDKESTQGFLDKLLPQRCRTKLSARGKVWLPLLEAVASRDAEAMLTHARQLLALSDATTSTGDTLYAAGISMLALLARGDREQAIGVKQQLTEKLLPPNVPLPFEILWIEALAGRT